MQHINLLRTYGRTSTQSWLDTLVHVPEPFSSSPVSNGLSSHPGSKLSSPLSQAAMSPPRFQARHSENCLSSTYPDTSNAYQAEDVSFDIRNGNQENDASFNIGNANQSIDVRFDISNGNHDDDASIDTSNGNQGRHASFNVHDRNPKCRDAIEAVDPEFLRLSRAFHSLSTDGIFELV